MLNIKPKPRIHSPRKPITDCVPCLIESHNGIIALLTKELVVVYLYDKSYPPCQGTIYNGTVNKDYLDNGSQWYLYEGEITLKNIDN